MPRAFTRWLLKYALGCRTPASVRYGPRSGAKRAAARRATCGARAASLCATKARKSLSRVPGVTWSCARERRATAKAVCVPEQVLTTKHEAPAQRDAAAQFPKRSLSTTNRARAALAMARSDAGAARAQGCRAHASSSSSAPHAVISGLGGGPSRHLKRRREARTRAPRAAAALQQPWPAARGCRGANSCRKISAHPFPAPRLHTFSGCAARCARAARPFSRRATRLRAARWRAARPLLLLWAQPWELHRPRAARRRPPPAPA